jgi:hypothetical protein
MEHFAYKSTPITFLRAELDSGVLELLQRNPLLCLSENELSQCVGGFTRACDNPRNVDHVYFEGYAHADFSASCEPCVSMNPRTGRDYGKPAAPAALLAFFEATRRANAALLADLAARLDGVAAGSAAALLADLVRRGRAWADLALQTHYGADEPGIWHSDGANSLLHLAVSVRGTRALLSVDDGRHTRAAPRRAELAPGSAYLTAPALFPHAVEYVGARTHGDRILAVQARFLASGDEFDALEGARRGATAEWAAIAGAISGALTAAGGLRLPSLAAVRAALAELRAPGPPGGVRFLMVPPSAPLPPPPAVSPAEALALLRGDGGGAPPRFVVAFPNAPCHLRACAAVLSAVDASGAVAEYAFPPPLAGESPLARAARLVGLMFEDRAPPFPLAALALAPEKAAAGARNHRAELYLWASAHGADVPRHAPLWRSEEGGGVVTEGSSTLNALRAHFGEEIRGGLAAPCAVRARLPPGAVEDAEKYLFDAAWRGAADDVQWALAEPPEGLGARGGDAHPGGAGTSALEKSRQLGFHDIAAAIEAAAAGRQRGGGV